MIYPKWLPRPKCWLKALELLLYNIPVMFLVSIFVTYYAVYGFPLFVGNESHIPYYLISGILLTLTMAWLGFSFTYNLFWGKEDEPKTWKILPPKTSLREGFFMLCSSIIAYILTIILSLPFAPAYRSCLNSYNYGTCIDNYKIFAGIITIIWLIIVAYCYRLKANSQP
jgi:hypothetical protein